jgi:hypothetical protein
MAEEKSAVYVPWATFLNALDQLAQGIPNRIDRSVFPGFSGAVQAQLLAGFKFLGLTTEDGTPTPAMNSVAVSDPAARKHGLNVIIQNRYSELFDLDLTKATPSQLSERISEAYSVQGDTKKKALRFFLSAVGYLDLPISPLFKVEKSAGSASVTTRRRRVTGRSKATTPPAETPKGRSSGTSRTVALRSGGSLTLSADVDIFGLAADDREFVFKVIDTLEAYANGDDEEEDET